MNLEQLLQKYVKGVSVAFIDKPSLHEELFHHVRSLRPDLDLKRDKVFDKMCRVWTRRLPKRKTHLQVVTQALESYWKEVPWLSDALTFGDVRSLCHDTLDFSKLCSNLEHGKAMNSPDKRLWLPYLRDRVSRMPLSQRILKSPIGDSHPLKDLVGGMCIHTQKMEDRYLKAYASRYDGVRFLIFDQSVLFGDYSYAGRLIWIGNFPNLTHLYFKKMPSILRTRVAPPSFDPYEVYTSDPVISEYVWVSQWSKEPGSILPVESYKRFLTRMNNLS